MQPAPPSFTQADIDANYAALQKNADALGAQWGHFLSLGMSPAEATNAAIKAMAAEGYPVTQIHFLDGKTGRLFGYLPSGDPITPYHVTDTGRIVDLPAATDGKLVVENSGAGLSSVSFTLPGGATGSRLIAPGAVWDRPVHSTAPATRIGITPVRPTPLDILQGWKPQLSSDPSIDFAISPNLG